MAVWRLLRLADGLIYGAAGFLPRTESGAVVQCVRKLKTSTWWDEHLTGDNVEFLKREVTEEYSELTAAKLNPLKDEPWPRHQWEEQSRRVGLVAVKLGMMPVWTKSGDRHVVTMLQVQDCHVIKHVPKDEYDGTSAALVVGAKNVSPFYRSVEYLEMFQNAGVPPKQKLTTFRVTENAVIKPGTRLVELCGVELTQESGVVYRPL
ncbi:39S ribosomal protein L3, mitochondrial [Tachysurus ichikawai]